MASAVASAMECVTRMGSTRNEPTLNGSRGRVVDARVGEDLVFSERRSLDQADGVRRRPDGDVVAPQQVRQSPDADLRGRA